MKNVRRGWEIIRHGMFVPIAYLVLTGLVYWGYHLLLHWPEARGLHAPSILAVTGNLLHAYRRIWFIFAFGFVFQLYCNCRRWPSDMSGAPTLAILKHGTWISINAGFFEELIFRGYAYLSILILLRHFKHSLDGPLHQLTLQVIFPAMNVVTFDHLHRHFSPAHWVAGLALIVTSIFFSKAHLHHDRLSRAIVWAVGMFMFWLLINYGLLAAIIGHFLYDFCVYLAVVVMSPFQAKPAMAEEYELYR